MSNRRAAAVIALAAAAFFALSFERGEDLQTGTWARDP